MNFTKCLIRHLWVFAILVGTTTQASEEIHAHGAELILVRENYSNGGCIYDDWVRRGHVEFYDEHREPIFYLPVVIEAVSLGVTCYGWTHEANRKITVANLDGKSLRDMLGSYWGLKGGLIAVGGGGAFFALNAEGILLGDMNFKAFGLGIDLSGLKVKIYPAATDAPYYSSSEVTLIKDLDTKVYMTETFH
jgi:hypothetical protein